MSVASLAVPADNARFVEQSLQAACLAAAFPVDEEFKWSPSRTSWMHSGLVGEARASFFTTVASVLLDGGCFASIVMEDDGRNPANSGLTAEQDVVVLVLERVANRLKELGDTGLVIADRPGGGRREEDQFVADCLRFLDEGTPYVRHDEIAFVLTSDSRFVRLLQAADLVASCLTAYVAGERVYSPRVAMALLPLFPVAYQRRAGYSIKIHPSYSFANLHHWLFGDTHWVRFQNGVPMPLRGWSYDMSPDAP